MVFTPWHHSTCFFELRTLRTKTLRTTVGMKTADHTADKVGLKSDGTTGQMTGHLAARGSASRYMACRKATRQVTELTTV